MPLNGFVSMNLSHLYGADADATDYDRGMSANAFVAKAVLGLSATTVAD